MSLVMSLIMAVLVLIVVFQIRQEGSLKKFFFAPKEGSKMTDGRHRTATEEDAYAPLQGIEAPENWHLTHHIYPAMDLKSADAVALYLTKEAPGRRADWHVKVPQTVQWKAGIGEDISEEAFMDYYLQTVSERFRSVN